MRLLRKNIFNILALSMLLTFISTSVIFGYDKNLLDMFKENNPKYLSITIENEINAETYVVYEQKVKDIQQKIDTLKEQIADIENQGTTTNDSVSIVQENILKNAKSEILELEKQKSDYVLKRDLAKYYVTYSEDIIDESQRRLEYDIYKKHYKIQLYEIKLDYYSKIIEEFEEKLSIERAKFKEGYITEAQVEEIEVQLNSQKIEYDALKSEQALLKETIKENGGKYEEVKMEIPVKKITKDYVKLFYEKNMKERYYTLQINTYSKYKDELQEYDDAKQDIINAELQKKLSELNLKQYKIDTELYVKTLKERYENNLKQIQNKEREIELQEKKIENSKLLYEYGKIQKIEITSIQTELEKLKYEKGELLYELNIEYYILNNYIEGEEL